jgi:hypothetical protein
MQRNRIEMVLRHHERGVWEFPLRDKHVNYVVAHHVWDIRAHVRKLASSDTCHCINKSEKNFLKQSPVVPRLINVMQLLRCSKQADLQKRQSEA